MESVSKPKIAFIGCGNMGEAMLSGWLISNDGIAAQIDSGNIYVVVASDESARRIADEYNVAATTTISELPAEMDMVVLAVKPQIIDSVMEDLAKSDVMEGESPLIVSVAAGVTTQHIEDSLGDDVRVVRTMPNLPLKIGLGSTGICSGSNANADDVELVEGLFEAIGSAAIVAEDEMDAVCALSGGGPAYFAYMIECLSQAGVAAGLSSEISEKLALGTFLGTAELIGKTGVSPAVLRESVSSPGGTTLAALSALAEDGYAQAIEDGISAAVRRSKELQ